MLKVTEEIDLSLPKSVFKKNKPTIVITGDMLCGEHQWIICLKGKIEGEIFLMEFVKSDVIFESTRKAFDDAKLFIAKCKKFKKFKKVSN